MANVQADETKSRNLLSKLKLRNIWYPIVIGLAAVSYMIYNEVDFELFKTLSFSGNTALWLLVAIMFMLCRDIGYIIRIKILSSGELTWLQATRVIMLWEFTSAVTPSAIGGTAFALIYLHKEGISVGKSSTIVLLTSFFDELYFVVMFPLLIFTIGTDKLFGTLSFELTLQNSLLSAALIGYSLKFIYTIVISYGLFINPMGLKWLLEKIFSIGFLRRWHSKAIGVGDEIVTTSKDISKRNLKFWSGAVLSTFLSWSSRYFVVNAIILAFFSFSEHILLFARQLIMWIMMLVMPTPGGSGFVEYLFTQYLSDLVPVAGLTVVIALIWRLITYYPYLFIGAFLLPRWIKSKFKSRD